MKTINEVYAGRTYSEIETSLKIAGALAETFRRKGASLTDKSRQIISEARESANRYGLSRQMVNSIEAEGAKAARS